jgi:hypothetical protein
MQPDRFGVGKNRTREQEEPAEDSIRPMLNGLGRAIADLLRQHNQTTGDHYAFCLLMFQTGTSNGRMNYLSNANREDMLDSMAEFLERNRTGIPRKQ